jgi:peptidoglycan/xylan/chitin deacetylase (PgdA/CDA1 family)
MNTRSFSHATSRGIAAATASLALLALAGCGNNAPVGVGEGRAVAATSATPAPEPSPTPRPAPVVESPEKLGINEVGRIPVLMYHSVGEKAKYDRHGLNIPPALFRKHMQMLHDNGFYPMNMRDILSARIDVPVGKIPVVITFDDARGSQFQYRRDGSIDPDCAVGILDSFHAKYGDEWLQRAVFYNLPRSKYNPTPFWQPGLEGKKVKYLVAEGYEIGNHSTSHRALSKLSGSEVTWEMTFCRDYFRQLDPGATMDTMALPYGIYPKKEFIPNILKAGNRCILMAWGDASYAPTDKRYDKTAVMRIGSEPGNIEKWVAALTRDKRAYGKALRPYVSDGNPDTVTVPDSYAASVNRNALGGAQLVVYKEPKPAGSPAKKGKKPAKSGGASKSVKKPIES